MYIPNTAKPSAKEKSLKVSLASKELPPSIARTSGKLLIKSSSSSALFETD